MSKREPATWCWVRRWVDICPGVQPLPHPNTVPTWALPVPNLRSSHPCPGVLPAARPGSVMEAVMPSPGAASARKDSPEGWFPSYFT